MRSWVRIETAAGGNGEIGATAAPVTPGAPAGADVGARSHAAARRPAPLREGRPMDLRTLYVAPRDAARLAEALQEAGYEVTAAGCAGHLKRLIDALEPADAGRRRVLYYLADSLLFGGYDNADQTPV